MKLLVYSASSAVGMASVQLCRLLSPTRPIIALASPASHELLYKFGATHCLSYSDPDLLTKINDLHLPPIQLVVDCFSEGDSTRKCETLMSGTEGRIVRMMLPFGKAKEGVEIDWIFAYTITGKVRPSSVLRVATIY